MPSLFLPEAGATWIAARFVETPTTVSGPYPRIVRAPPAEAPICLIAPGRGPTDCAVLVPPGTRLLVNEMPVTAGLRVLGHRDALRLEGGPPFYFSAEEEARVEPFAGGAAMHCPRCRTEVRAGEAAVRCPGCGLVHHQREDHPCWTYAPKCAGCDQPTDLGAGLRWSPEDL